MALARALQSGRVAVCPPGAAILLVLASVGVRPTSGVVQRWLAIPAVVLAAFAMFANWAVWAISGFE